MLGCERAVVIAGTIALLMLPVKASSSPVPLDVLAEDKLLALFTRARGTLIKEIIKSRDSFVEHGIDTEARIRHFVIQIATETDGLQRLDEYMSYSPGRLVEVFGKRVSPEKARALAFKPTPTANYVYANRLGNGDEASGDGWRYRGSGFIQLTGRENFRKRGKELGLPLELQPDLVRQPTGGLKAALMYWTARKINAAADRDDLQAVRILVNGRLTGIEHAQLWATKVKKYLVFGDPKGDLSPDELAAESAIVSQALQRMGYMPPAGSSGAQISLEEAVTNLQRDLGLELTGYVDEDTFYALVDTQNIEKDP